MQTQLQGRFAENLACDYLSTQGLHLYGKNFHRRIGEIDLIMLEPLSHTTVLIEVRYRNSTSHGGPLESINTRKRRKLLKTAQLLQQQLADPHAAIRLDVVGVTPTGVLDKTQELKLALSDIHYAVFQEHNITWIKNAITQ